MSSGSYSCLISFLLISSLFRHQTVVKTHLKTCTYVLLKFESKCKTLQLSPQHTEKYNNVSADTQICNWVLSYSCQFLSLREISDFLPANCSNMWSYAIIHDETYKKANKYSLHCNTYSAVYIYKLQGCDVERNKQQVGTLFPSFFLMQQK